MNQYRVSIGLFGVILILLACAWTFWPREKPVVGEAIKLPVAKEVREVEKVIYRPKYIYVYPDKSKSRLNLPKSIVADETKKVTVATHLDAEERPYTLSGVLDTQTGNTEIYARPDPLPWLAPGKRGAVGVSYGLRNGDTDGMVYAYHDLLQIKALHAGARGEVDQHGDYFAGGYVEYRF